MSEKKIVVPEGMLNAVAETKYGDQICSIETAVSLRDGVRKDIEVALRWLSENPIMPTDEQLDEMEGDIRYRVGVNFDIQKLISEWQRRMFFAPEPEAPRFFDTPFGRFEVDNRVPPGEIRLHNWNGPTLMRNIKIEPEVPEPDPLVMYIMRHFDDAIADEASLRNRASCAVADYEEHLKRNPAVKEKGPVIQDFKKFEQEIQERRDTEAREECKDLLFPTPQGIPVVLANDCVTVQADVNNRIIQAYNHGKDAGYAERSSETFGR